MRIRRPLSNTERTVTQTPVVHRHRRGALFHYYLVYVMMSGTVMASAGLCLHAIFKSGHADEMVMLQLNTLARMERALRQDVANASQVVTGAPGQLLCFMPSSAGESALVAEAAPEAAEQVVWLADDTKMIRTHLVNASLVKREVFQFLAGSQVLVTADDSVRSVNSEEQANAERTEEISLGSTAANTVFVDVLEPLRSGISRQNPSESAAVVLARIVLFTTAASTSAAPATARAASTTVNSFQTLDLDTGSSERQGEVRPESTDHLAATTGGLL